MKPGSVLGVKMDVPATKSKEQLDAVVNLMKAQSDKDARTVLESLRGSGEFVNVKKGTRVKVLRPSFKGYVQVSVDGLPNPYWVYWNWLVELPNADASEFASRDIKSASEMSDGKGAHTSEHPMAQTTALKSRASARTTGPVTDVPATTVDLADTEWKVDNPESFRLGDYLQLNTNGDGQIVTLDGDSKRTKDVITWTTQSDILILTTRKTGEADHVEKYRVQKDKLRQIGCVFPVIGTNWSRVAAADTLDAVIAKRQVPQEIISELAQLQGQYSDAEGKNAMRLPKNMPSKSAEEIDRLNHAEPDELRKYEIEKRVAELSVGIDKDSQIPLEQSLFISEMKNSLNEREHRQEKREKQQKEEAQRELKKQANIEWRRKEAEPVISELETLRQQYLDAGGSRGSCAVSSSGEYKPLEESDTARNSPDESKLYDIAVKVRDIIVTVNAVNYIKPQLSQDLRNFICDTEITLERNEHTKQKERKLLELELKH